MTAVLLALFTHCLNLHEIIDRQKNAGNLGTF